MSWFKAKPVTQSHNDADRAPKLDPHTELRIARILTEHGRLAARKGRPLIALLGSAIHHDGGIDYSVRTRVRGHDGTERRFDSHLRLYPDRVKLIR